MHLDLQVAKEINVDNEIKPVSIFKYRGITVPIYLDDYGQCYYAKLENEEISFGSFNTNWQEDLKYLINQKLDLIMFIGEYPGAKLEWFDNGCSYRDIRLVYKSRTLKVFLVYDEHEITEISIAKLKKESLKILSKIQKISS